MFYVSRQVGRKYGVVDTSDNIEEFYSKSELEHYYNSGIEVKGVGYVKNKFTITPSVSALSRHNSAKNRLLRGTSTGLKGFDLKFEGDKVIALPLTEEFFDMVKEVAVNNRYILTIPEIVTHISDDFFNPPTSFTNGSSYVRFSVVLPKSLVVIGSGALSSFLIEHIEFTGKIDVIARGKSLNSVITSGTSDIKVKRLEYRSIFASSDLYLPDIEYMDESSIDYRNYRKNLSVYLGKNIKELTNFVVPIETYLGDNYRKVSSHLMHRATIVYFNDDCDLRKLDMNFDLDRYFDYDKYYAHLSSYIFVMNESLYKRVSHLFNSDNLNNNVVIGIITYKFDSELKSLRDNLSNCCTKGYKKAFKNYFTKEDLGTYKLLQFRNPDIINSL